jgi:hypothetical protein
MGNMSKKFIKSRWIPFICQSEEIKEEPPSPCGWNVTILFSMFVVSYDKTTRIRNQYDLISPPQWLNSQKKCRLMYQLYYMNKQVKNCHLPSTAYVPT